MADFTDEFADSAAGADDDFGTSPADLAAQLDAEEAALDDSDDSGSGDGDFGGDDGGDFGGDGDGGFVGAFVSDDDDAYSSNDGDSGDSDDDSDDDRNLHVRYGYHGLKGKRKTMEDDEYAHAEVVKRMEMDDFVGEEIETVVTQGFFGVYDGHGGSTTAHFLAEHLHVNCAANPGCYSGDLNEMTDAIRDGCEKTENDFMEYALKSMIDSGSTAVLGVVAGNALVVANVGDSEAILCRKGVPRVLSTIHNPKKNADEEQRVVDVGGRLFHKRVAHPTMPPSMCSIAVSRAFGDLMFKDPKYTREAQSGLTAEPSFEGLMITPNDEFLLLACDGVWDVLSYEDAIGMVSETLRATDDPKEAAKYVCEQALAQGSADNITAMVVVFDFVTTDRLYELWAADEEIRQRPPDTGAADAAAVVIYPVAGGEPYQGDAPWAGAYRNNPGFRRCELYRFPLLDYNDMVGSLDTQQFIQQQIRADPADFAAILDVPPHVTSWVWQYEHLRQVALELNHLAVMLDGVCTADTCPKMMATDEWMFLCAAHEDAKECSAVDYILHTLDGTAALLNNTKHFPNRSSVDSKSKQFLQSVARRLYRINAHAYFHHREVFDAFEEQTHLTERFGILVNRNKLIGKKQRIIPTDFWVNGGM